MSDKDFDTKRVWKYTLEDIANDCGLSIHTVREHKRKGWLVPGDRKNLARYIHGHQMRMRQKKGIISTDEFGEPKQHEGSEE